MNGGSQILFSGPNTPQVSGIFLDYPLQAGRFVAQTSRETGSEVGHRRGT